LLVEALLLELPVECGMLGTSQILEFLPGFLESHTFPVESLPSLSYLLDQRLLAQLIVHRCDLLLHPLALILESTRILKNTTKKCNLLEIGLTSQEFP
jgi:hypothetical protein